MKHKSFEDYLSTQHADQYTGTDDLMPEDWEEWLADLGVDELIKYADAWMKEERQKLLRWEENRWKEGKPDRVIGEDSDGNRGVPTRAHLGKAAFDDLPVEGQYEKLGHLKGKDLVRHAEYFRSNALRYAQVLKALDLFERGEDLEYRSHRQGKAIDVEQARRQRDAEIARELDQLAVWVRDAEIILGLPTIIEERQKEIENRKSLASDVSEVFAELRSSKEGIEREIRDLEGKLHEQLKASISEADKTEKPNEKQTQPPEAISERFKSKAHLKRLRVENELNALELPESFFDSIELLYLDHLMKKEAFFDEMKREPDPSKRKTALDYQQMTEHFATQIQERIKNLVAPEPEQLGARIDDAPENPKGVGSEKGFNERCEMTAKEEAREIVNEIASYSNGEAKTNTALMLIESALSARDKEIEELKTELSKARLENTCFHGTSHPEIYKCEHEMKVDELKQAVIELGEVSKKAEHFFAFPEEYNGPDQAEIHMDLTDAITKHAQLLKECDG